VESAFLVVSEVVDLVEAGAAAVGPAAAAVSVEEVPVTVGDQRSTPAWMKEHFQEGDVALIKKAVENAETKTSGDIVPMVVHRSANLASVIPTLFLLILLVLILFGTQALVLEQELSFSLFCLTAAGVSLLLSWLLSRFEWVQRLCIPKALLSHEVHVRAELEFYRNHFDQTKAHGAVLIFVSLFERQVVVLYDEFLAKKIPQSEWDQVSSHVSSHMRDHRLVEGLSKAIQTSADILMKVLPVNEMQTHEISTDFRVKE